MALEGTHIRIALDVKDVYHVLDLEKYLSGTIYPDSRYVTKIERDVTHPADHLTWDLNHIDDFKKGWLVHLKYDKIQREVMKEMFPTAFEGNAEQGGDVWVKHTALKILQDLDDVKKFDIQQYFSFLEYAENPNGEDLPLIRRYNAIFPKMYADAENMRVENCHIMWEEFGIKNALIEKVKQQVKAYEQDADIMRQVQRIYPETLARLLEV